MKNKHVGILIICITLLFLLVIISFNNALTNIVNETCTHGVACPMQVTLRTQKIISYSLVGLLFIIGAFLSLFMKDERVQKKDEITAEEKEEKIKNLEAEEKDIMSILLREKGSTYQSDLIKETKLTKVKVSRVLDKLEGKGLIERKRRGMANIIILK